MRVLVVEDEKFMAEAIRDGLRLDAIAADIAPDGDTAQEMLSVNDYDIVVLDRDVRGSPVTTSPDGSSRNNCAAGSSW
jgi:two-component system response regulator VanR